MSDTYDKNRIVRNSLLLYVRMLFTMWLNLWTTRLVLANLGVEDMGVYGVVGSVVSMFAVFTSGVTTAVQRFITFEMGRKEGNVNSIFCSSLNVIFILSAFIIALLEIGGLWFLHNKVNIPAASIESAGWVFQLSVLTCVINLVSVPYNALIIAHEKMGAFASISILQVVLNCVAANCLTLFDNRLVWYAVLMAGIGLFVRVIYQVYCVKNFPESKFRFIIDKDAIKQLLGFMGAITMSEISRLINTQGTVLIINWMFGVALNAVFNIASQMKSAVMSFAFNLHRAMAPQITKTYANGEIETHKSLVYNGCKMMTFMIFFIMIPFLFRTEYIMKLWLGNVPDHMIIFAQCAVFRSLINAALEPINTAAYATNRVTRFLIIPDALSLIVLPLSYLVVKFTGSQSLFAITLVSSDFCVYVFRVYYTLKVSPITFRELLRSSIWPCVWVAALSVVACWGVAAVTQVNIIGLVELLAAHSALLCVIIYWVGLKSDERNQVRIIISQMWGRVHGGATAEK